MPCVSVLRSTPVLRSGRVRQAEGIFDLPPASGAHTRRWRHDLPFEDRKWSVGLIVGPSGAGKSSLAAELFGSPKPLMWDPGRAVVDEFPAGMPIQNITGLLSSVGFSSPPSWVRPYGTLSTGEQFRATVARTIAESDGVTVIDEFTSTVDRMVAKVASAAIAKHVRRSSSQFVAVTCHYDVEEWLQPDWTYDVASGEFSWRSVQPRPHIELEVYPSTPAAWPWFAHHHYLSGDLSRTARCWVALVDDRPAAFTSSIHFPHPRVKNMRREHRVVCLPDFQGIGIGNRVSELIASVHRAKGFRYVSTTSSPAMIRHRARSPLWSMIRKPSMVRSSSTTMKGMVKSQDRITATFEFVGPKASPEQCEALWVPATIQAARASG